MAIYMIVHWINFIWDNDTAIKIVSINSLKFGHYILVFWNLVIHFSISMNIFLHTKDCV